MRLAEEGGVDQLVSVDIERHNVEVLSVGGALVGVARDGHTSCAATAPGIVGAAKSAPQEYASPSAQVHAVADVDSKGRGRKVGTVGGHVARAEDGAPHQRVEPRTETRQHLAAVWRVVVGVVYQRAARSLGLAENEDVVILCAAHKIALVVGRRAELRAGHQLVTVI